MSASDLKSRLAARARAEGFDICRVTTPDAIPLAPERLRAWLAQGRHGAMGWMEERAGWRASPAALWPEARSIVMLGLSYAPPHDPLDSVSRTDRGALSVYAARRDYHEVIKGKLKTVAGALAGARPDRARAATPAAAITRRITISSRKARLVQAGAGARNHDVRGASLCQRAWHRARARLAHISLAPAR